MKKWEYLFLDAVWDIRCGYVPVAANSKKLRTKDESCIHEYVNGLGEEGWELTAVSETGNMMRLFFKRPKE